MILNKSPLNADVANRPGQLVQALNGSHGGLNVQGSHILPVLLQQRHQEIHGKMNILDLNKNKINFASRLYSSYKKRGRMRNFKSEIIISFEQFRRVNKIAMCIYQSCIHSAEKVIRF